MGAKYANGRLFQMQKAYYVNNRKRLYQHMDAGSLLAIFSGEELWKCGD